MRPHVMVATALLGFGSLGFSCRGEQSKAGPTPVEQRGARQAGVAEIAPGAAPARGPDGRVLLPVVGEKGEDEFGYPRRQVDRAALRSLLFHRAFDDLTDVVERLQAEFERDFHCEYWPDDAAVALGTGEMQILPLLEEWVRAKPQSFAPYLARGTHWVERAFERRGGNFASATPAENFVSMENAFKNARADLEHAVELRPKLLAAMRQQLRTCLPSGETLGPTGAGVMQRALAACPACFLVRTTYMNALTPRWGGSYAAMMEFTRRSQDPANPRLRLLTGYVDHDQANLLNNHDQYPGALAAAERACAVGPHAPFLEERARARSALGKPAEALADVDQAVALRPGDPDLLLARAVVLARANRWADAARDVRAAVQVEPSNPMARSVHQGVVQGLMYDGWLRLQKGDKQGALQQYDLAAELAPDNPEVQGRRAWMIEGGKKGLAEPVAVPDRAPDDFRAMQQLDYRLAARGQLGAVVKLWNDYLSRHPDEAQAYLERGGALFHLRRVAEARADAQKACDLGVSEGCLRAKQLGGPQ